MMTARDINLLIDAVETEFLKISDECDEARRLLTDIVDWFDQHRLPDDWPMCVSEAKAFVETRPT